MVDVQLIDGRIILDKYGNASTVDGLEADRQIIKNGLLIILGSWFDDVTAGVNWPAIVGKQYGVSAFKAEVRRALLALPIVQQVITLNLGTPDKDRGVVLTFVCRTTNGIVTFNEEL